ncbi:hypothetical protein [Clostridium tyrobutyricum]|uniref:hypothetical protein n=1 Tax=Clostridium tyrobutyricum TaxID=1519 RepID=UPI001C38D2BB|nr:hypothetical protein [Clostridium tyrobutyricum]MBV4429686.1 hypothetical protein [Clostridium tyrobutyricum]MBV4444921.1 hypothetical protein [Clostridium tyrobutyricum]
MKNDKLKHLTDIQIQKLMDRYYNNEKTSDLIKEYNIDVNSSRLYTLFSPLICEDKICPNCNIPLVIDRQSRSSSSYSFNNKAAYCPKCNHKDSPSCNCPSCSEKKRIKKIKKDEEQRQKIIRKRELINVHYSLDCKRIKIEELSFRDKVYLGALLRLCLSEDLLTIFSTDSMDNELAPTNDLKREIITTLSHKKIIIVNPNSPIEAFPESDEDPFPEVYYIYYVNYFLNIYFSNDTNREEIINNLINPPEFIKSNSEEAFEIWRDIALAECLEYLKFQMDSVRFDFNPGKKTIAVFNDLLDDFSVSQIYGIIYKSIANATKFYQESDISRKQAANSVIGGCQRYAEKALINNWDLTKYHRVKDYPQTIISEFFFNRIVKIGTLGFDMPPTIL